ALDPSTSAYAPALGLAHARSAIAEHLSGEYGATVPDDHVQVTGGCNQAFCLAVQAITEPGDEVVLPVPYYFNHDMWLRAMGVDPVYCALDPAARFVPDAAQLRSCVSDRTRAIVLVSPNNPTGAEYATDVIAACFDVARDAGIALILDETYKDFREAEGS